MLMVYVQQVKCGGVKRCQHATTEGHSEDSHPDAWGLPPAHPTGPGNTLMYCLLCSGTGLHRKFCFLVEPF